jgi:hypothetical protein
MLSGKMDDKKAHHVGPILVVPLNIYQIHTKFEQTNIIIGSAPNWINPIGNRLNFSNHKSYPDTKISAKYGW